MSANLTPIKLVLLESEEKSNKIILKYINKRIDNIVSVGKVFFSEITLLDSAKKCNCSPGCQSQKFPHFIVATGQKFYGDVRNMISYLDGKTETVQKTAASYDPEQAARDYVRDLIMDGVSKQGDQIVVKPMEDDELGENMGNTNIHQKIEEHKRARDPKGKKSGLTLNYNTRDEPKGETKIQPLERGTQRDDDDYETHPEIKSNVRHGNAGYQPNSIMETLEINIKNNPNGNGAVDNDMIRAMYDKLQGSNDF